VPIFNRKWQIKLSGRLILGRKNSAPQAGAPEMQQA
jgi:hypothetical protein